MPQILGLSHKDNLLGSLARGLWRRPLLLVLLAHTVFSVGIWNARDGYGEDTSNVVLAWDVLQTRHPSPSLYIDLIAACLRYFTSDPVTALTFMKYLSSLLATVALCVGLSCFSSRLRPGAIVFACFLWIASSLDAPFSQSTSLSLFAFAIMLLGIDCLLVSRSVWGALGFYCFGLLAAGLRPEYLLPVALMTFVFLGQAVWAGAAALKSRLGWPRGWTCGAAVCLTLAGGAAFCLRPPAAMVTQAAFLDHYALFGLGQCYADFYHREHPAEVFDAGTEYAELLDRTFNKPAGFCAAVRNNPSEALRYFALNAGRNLVKSAPGALLDRYREETERRHHGVLCWVARAILLAGALMGAARLHRVGRRPDGFSFGSVLAAVGRDSMGRKLGLFLLLLSTSLVATVLLIGSPRYYLGWVPLFYLGVASCADSLLRAFNLFRYEPRIVALSFIFLCAPNFLAPRPNYEFDAVRQVASRVKEYPVVAGWWTAPDALLGLRGKATPISIFDGIHRADIEGGKIDILMLDSNFRKSRTWAEQKDFFERFERRPETFGFKKATGIPTGRFAIYYRQ
jgi:hypothetical protein